MNKHPSERRVVYIVNSLAVLSNKAIPEYSFKVAAVEPESVRVRGQKAQWKTERNGRR